MPIVTLTTDYGNKDFSIGALKGSILKSGESVTIVDISHNITSFNITEAAFILNCAYRDFPEGTIHIVTVNDMDSRECRTIAIEYDNHYFLGFDNGVLSMLMQGRAVNIVELEDQGESSISFPGKEVFANASAELANGKTIASIGRVIPTIKERNELMPIVQKSLIRGTVIYVDSYQNLILNITRDLFVQVGENSKFVMSFRRGDQIDLLSESYHDVPQGEKLCLFNSNGYMEIAINSGKASSLLGLSLGDTVQIDFI